MLAGNIRSEIPAHLQLIRVIGLMEQLMNAAVVVAKCVPGQQMALGCMDRCGRQFIKKHSFLCLQKDNTIVFEMF